ncbi:MAG: putative DNA binding domain-containing protein, partial [Myxococcales bacterium]|nr:putative DNA binding domain-containing protein [Myxococcales bacterium]
MIARFDIHAYLGRAEGPHFDRKSLFEGPPGRKRSRDRRRVRDQIAEYCAAFANADGGVLLLGVEDGGEVTGHRLPAAAVEAMLRVPAERLDPPQPPGFAVQVDGHEVLAFEVPMAGAPVMVVGDGYPLRMGDRTVAASYEQVQALKFRGLMQSFEALPSTLSLDDLDADAVAAAQAGAGLAHLPAADYLVERRLADWLGRQLVLRQAAELLFHPGLPEHPNAGVRIFRVVGRERRTGLEHNVEELPRVEGALPRVLDQTFRIITGLLRRPSRLTSSGKFRQTWEYPEFSWKEAVLNAVAHRDYRVQGRGVEVWLFDDRLEVTNPGGLMEGVTLEQLLRLERVHVSRNPRMVRALVDLGHTRDQGEGLPRMFWEMDAEFLPRPEVQATPHEVRLTLRNTMTLTKDDRAFIEGLGGQSFSPAEYKALLEAHRHGRIDNARLRALGGLDTLEASQILRRLRDHGHLALHAAGPASFYTLREERGAPTTERRELDADRGELDADRGELTAD